MLMRRFSSQFYYLSCMLAYSQYGFRGTEVLVRVNMFTGMAQLWQSSRLSWSSPDITYHNLREYSEELNAFYGPLPEYFFYQEA